MPLFKNFRQSVRQLSKASDHVHIPPHVVEQAIETATAAMEKCKPGQSKIIISPSKKENAADKHDQTLIVVITQDMPFLIDSIAAECVGQGYTIEGVLHNTLSVKRKPNGDLVSADVLSDNGEEKGYKEAFLIITLQSILGKTQQKIMDKALQDVIIDVRFATSDWYKMRDALQNAIDDLDRVQKAKDKKMFDEYKAFLQYIHDNNFTLLGYREYKLRSKGNTAESEIVKNSGLGVLSDAKRPVYINQSRQALPSELQQIRLTQPTLTIAKVNKLSTVHRRVPLDAIAVKTYDKKGNITGEKLFIGLFTSVTYSRSIQDIPYLRYKVNAVLEATGYVKNSHNYRALMHILEKYPRDELFQIDIKMLQHYAVSIMALQEQPKVALYVREDPFKRYVSCLVYVPREKYETDLRIEMQVILEKIFHGRCEVFYTVLDDSPLARVNFRITLPEGALSEKFDYKAIENQLIDAARSWEEKIRSVLLQQCTTEKKALELTKKYARAFPAGYQDQISPLETYQDILKIEDLLKKRHFEIDLYQPSGAAPHALNIKFYHYAVPVTLSSILPILENFGFEVIAERPFEITIEGEEPLWIHDFDIQFKNPDHARPVEDIKDVIEDALNAIWRGDIENDSLNAIIAKAKMPWRDVLVLRTLVKYMRQANIQYTPDYMMQALTDYPDIAGLMLELFYAAHDPSLSNDKRKTQVKSFCKKINKGLEDVSSFDQDKILRSMLQILTATLRTNFFQNKSYVSFKFDSQKIDILPLPRPYVEIFVYSPRVEGIHLRGGKIARGGLRWSDRHEDFRTEILGLMKAQNVKNAVIVPVGSKGGFVVKKPPKAGDRDSFVKEGIECYKIFISGLLDITDNLKDKKVIAPAHVVCHDGDDPYLVVAADKGTATFSDIANNLSEEYGFWMGDAFASGGSAGYDHKIMGITARGAWESVKRHFRELGKDIQSEEFDVIGVGDMGGDVFGNGMLLSQKIRLIGAFNHLHIFCDPNPDIAASFKERKRLFKAVKGWDHYNEGLLSKGGKIYSRSDKLLKLTPEIREAFDIDKKEVSPQELMHAMLSAKTDLLWFGGIGTYIKSPNESHAQAGDKANDSIRVDAHQVRAKVIGEGANLGTTHLARIAMSLLGIQCYADFIDNAGGVNSSDLEVNIKILFQNILQNKSLTVKERNKLLSKMTDDVSNLVLRNNYQQTQAISVATYDAFSKLPVHAALIEYLELHGGLDRAIEYLPNSTTLEDRARNYQGLMKPEMSTLISYMKIKLFQDLVDSNLPDDPAFQNWMVDYFPTLMQTKYKDIMKNHRLKREIIATQTANSIVNRAGPSFVMNQVLRTGLPACTIARVYFIVRQVFNLPGLYEGIEALDNVANAGFQVKALDAIANFVDYTSTWFLQHVRIENLKEAEFVKTGDRYKKGVQQLLKSMDQLLPQSSIDFVNENQAVYQAEGFNADLAKSIALLPIMTTACDIIRISDQQSKDIKTVAKVYFELNEVFSFVWLRGQATSLKPESRWEAETLKGLIDRFYVIQADLTKRIVGEVCKGKSCPINPVNDWVVNQSRSVQSVIEIIQNMKDSQSIDFAMLTSIEMRLGRLA